MVMADCPFTKVAVMQLFYELKQKFPTIPDQVVSDLIVQTSYNRKECEEKLREKQKRSESLFYPFNMFNKIKGSKERPKTLPIGNHKPNGVPLFNFGSRVPHVEEERNLNSGTTTENTCRCVSKKEESQQNEKIDSMDYPKKILLNGKCGSRECLTDLHKSVQNIEITNNQSEVFVSDLTLCVQEDPFGCERTSLQVKYAKSPTSSSLSAPTTPSSGQNSIDCDLSDDQMRKHRSSLIVDRSPGFSRILEPKRPSTSVMLTLRPASSEGQPAVSIATKGSQLMYATSHYNPKDGYQNQLEIKIGEDGNPTLTASRLKTNIIPTEQTDFAAGTPTFADEVTNLLPVLDNALSPTLELRLREQRGRKQRLKAEINRNKQRLKQINQEIYALEKDLERRKRTPHQSEKVLRLRSEVQALRNECHRMVDEMELRENSVAFITTGGNGDTDHWKCKMCTFINHPMLPKCEQCDMARLDIGNSLANILRPPTVSAQLSSTHP